MRILLIAYEFPPIQAAQSLRWYYLGNALASCGAEIDVLTVRIHDLWGEDWPLHPNISVHRCFPGPFVGVSGWLRHRLTRAETAELSSAENRIGIAEKIYRLLRRGLDQLLVPDVRTEWFPFAWSRLQALVAQRRPDLIISSHEPGVDLLLGLRAKRCWKLPWIADLADPVLAPYTPRWRKMVDNDLERRVCQTANRILVTNQAMAELMCQRHGLPLEQSIVIQQGFAISELSSSVRSLLIKASNHYQMLDLVYTGTFYRDFRNPSPLFQAIKQVPEVRLVYAGDSGGFESELAALGEQAIVLGRCKHRECLRLQSQAAVLISIGNRQTHQIPGKIFEYLGACRPILHLFYDKNDPVKVLLETLRRGQSTLNEKDAIQANLKILHDSFRAAKLDETFDLSPQIVSNFSWQTQGERLWKICKTIP
ncbi:MAG: glycosyltransferase [Candidatus Competibacteraceae bacterium]